MIKIQSNPGLDVAVNFSKPDASRPEGSSFFKDMENALKKSSQDAPKSNAQQDVRNAVKGNNQQTDQENESSETVEQELSVLGQFFMMLNAQGGIQNSEEVVTDANIELLSSQVAVIPEEPVLEQPVISQEVVEMQAEQSEGLTSEQRNTIIGVLEDIKNSTQPQDAQVAANVSAEVSAKVSEEKPVAPIVDVAEETQVSTDKQSISGTQTNIVDEKSNEADLNFAQSQQQFNMLTDDIPREVDMEFSTEAVQSKGPDSFAMKFLEQVTTNIAENKSELLIQFKPEVMGGMAVKLVLGEEGLVAKLITGNKEVQAAMNSQLHLMQDALKSRNIDVVSMEVVYEQPTQLNLGMSNGGQQFFHHGQQSSSSHKPKEESVNVNAVYDSILNISDEIAESVEFSA